jgi:hypothetical protein
MLFGNIASPYQAFSGVFETDIQIDELQNMIELPDSEQSLGGEDLLTQIAEQITGLQNQRIQDDQSSEKINSQEEKNGGRSSISTLGTSTIVPISQWGCQPDLVTEPGSIELYEGYVDDPLPMCLTNDSISDWYAKFLAIGGYDPYDGFIDLYQKGMYMGRVYIEWTLLDKEEGDCCSVDRWLAEFYVKDKICLDSSFFPYVVGHGFGVCEQGLIPGKEVWFEAYTNWTGCPMPDQRFLITAEGMMVVEQGYIEILDCNIPHTGEYLPLCIEDTTWWILFYSVGGYHPVFGKMIIKQKDKMYRVRADIRWRGPGKCCSDDLWWIGFYIEEICLDSSYYPTVSPDVLVVDHEGLIPGKEVDLMFFLMWAGCGDPDQRFAMLSVRDRY